MKIYFTTLYVVGVLLIKNSISGKSLFFNKYLNGPHFELQKRNDKVFDDTKENFDKDSEEAFINSFKRSAEEYQPLKRTAYDDYIRKRSPYGLVYNQGKPIGILEPIPQSFEYSSYVPRDVSYRNGLYKSQWYPVKRDSDMELDEMDKDELESQTAALHSSNYANVLAKFKVNNKVKHRPYQDYLANTPVKRESIDFGRKKEMDDLKKRGALDMGNLQLNLKDKAKGSTDFSSTKVDIDKVNELEENLKDVMGDMGLVEKDKEAGASRGIDSSVKKREIYFEDEDLENGLNKIGLTKESHYDRNKKEDCPGKTKVAKSKGSKKFAMDKAIHKKGKKKVRKDEDMNSKRSIKSKKKRAEKNVVGSLDLGKKKVANYQYEGEEFIRRKRQGKQMEKYDDSEIMKGLESSGDLTVSGNKSPLVAVTTADEAELKKSQEKRDKEELEYEKRLERNIQAKINSIKEEVKREISKIKTEGNTKDQKREKRDIASNTLLDEETSILDPGVNIDHKLEPHIRKRRDLDNGVKTKDEQGNKKKREANIENSKKDAKAEDEAIKKTSNSAENTQKVKRNDEGVKEVVKKNLDNEKIGHAEKTVNKREDKVAEPYKATSDEKKHTAPVKRNVDTLQLSAELVNSNIDSEVKNIEKRDNAYIATDKIETDNKAEFGTDAPDSVVKRSDQISGDKMLSDTAGMVKRNDDLEGTTEKCLDKAADSKVVSIENVQNIKRDDRGINEIPDLETGQTILKDIDFENSENEGREERQSASIDEFTNSKLHGSSNDLADSSIEQKQEVKEEEKEETRGDRSVTGSKTNKENSENKDKLDDNQKDVKRNTEKDRSRRDALKEDGVETATGSDSDLDNKHNLIDSEASPGTLEAEKRNAPSDLKEDSEEVALEQRSVDNQPNGADASLEGSLSQRSTGKNVAFADTLEAARRRRSTNRRSKNRRKRDETSYSENKAEQTYRGENDGEIDDEDDEMHDDGFDDQTANFIGKREANDYDTENYGANEEQEANEDYPVYMERNKRNALRLYDDENDAEESYDNFLFSPNRYSRKKRHNYENLVAVHGGGMMSHSAARREMNRQPYEQTLRRKRLEKLNNRMHDQDENVAELSDSDIFGGFPQSYEGELSRFKRVKRSTIK